MNEQIESYNFFSSLFFNLPDKPFVEKILAYDFNAEAPGVDLIKSYIKSAEGRNIEDIRTEIAVDRTYLLHGLTPDNGPRPPYESLYVGDSQEVSVLSLNRFFRKHGFKLQEDGVGQPPDYLGIELAFMELLIKQGDVTFETRKEFFTQHLGKWGHLYAREMIKFAKTDFYRGIGHLLNSFLEEEACVYS